MTRMSFVLFMVCVVRGLWPNVNRIHALGLQPQAAILLCLAYVAVLVRELMLARPLRAADASDLSVRAA
jgi:hypothetical protein